MTISTQVQKGGKKGVLNEYDKMCIINKKKIPKSERKKKRKKKVKKCMHGAGKSSLEEREAREERREG